MELIYWEEVDGDIAIEICRRVMRFIFVVVVARMERNGLQGLVPLVAGYVHENTKVALQRRLICPIGVFVVLSFRLM